MAEFDFDELDRAVGSLMNKGPRDSGAPNVASVSYDANDSNDTSSQTKANENSLAPANSNFTTDQNSSFSEPEIELNPSGVDSVPSLTPQPVVTSSAPRSDRSSVSPLATKRRGQFMDMKHSSAAMKPVNPQNSGAGLPRRGINLSPLSKKSSLDSQTESVAPEPTVEKVSMSSSDLDDLNRTIDQNLSPDHEPAVVAKSDDSQTSSSKQYDVEIGSPFLADAKVQKRPLGLTRSQNQDVTNQSDSQSTTNSEDNTDEIESEPGASSLPQELHDQVMQIESDTTRPNKTSELKTPNLAFDENPVTVDDQSIIESQTANDSSRADLEAEINDQINAELNNQPEQTTVSETDVIQNDNQEIEPVVEQLDSATQTDGDTQPMVDEVIDVIDTEVETETELKSDDDYTRSSELAASSSGSISPASIPRQYQTKDETLDTGAKMQSSMYDSDLDHITLAKQSKKRSQFSVVLIVVALLALGAGAGAVLFMFQSGSL